MDKENTIVFTPVILNVPSDTNTQTDGYDYIGDNSMEDESF